MTTTDTDRIEILRVCYDTIVTMADNQVDIMKAMLVLATAPALVGRETPDESLFERTLASIARGIETETGQTRPDPGSPCPVQSPVCGDLIAAVTCDAVVRLDELGADPTEAAIVFAVAGVKLVLGQEEGDPVAVAWILRDQLRQSAEERLKAAAAVRSPSVH